MPSLPAIERVPVELWSQVLSQAEVTPPVLLALRDELLWARSPDKPPHPLRLLGVAACEDRLMAPFVGRKERIQRNEAARQPFFEPGYHLQQFATRLRQKDKGTRVLVLAAYQRVLPHPRRKYRDLDVVCALFVHDKYAWNKVDPSVPIDTDLCWMAALFRVHGTWGRASKRLQGSFAFALTCFSFDEQADLKSAKARFRDHSEIVGRALKLRPLSFCDASPRLQRSEELSQSVADDGIAFFCEVFLGGRTDLKEDLRGLSRHIAVKLRSEQRDISV